MAGNDIKGFTLRNKILLLVVVVNATFTGIFTGYLYQTQKKSIK